MGGARYWVMIAMLLLAFAPPVAARERAAMLPEEEALFALMIDPAQMVEVATRAPKPLNQIAENVTVITAEQITAMHAHSLGEVLSRQAGVFLSFSGREIIGDEPLRLLGTRRHHTLVLIDGVRLNLSSTGYSLVNFVPLGIVKRIEIIKGPASSAWGSSLGGVVNILTKETGSGAPTAGISASYGEAATRDLAADLAVGNDQVGLFLYGGNIDSDGLKNERYSERDALFGKLRLALPGETTLTAAAGSGDLSFKALDWRDAWGIANLDIYDETTSDNLWATLYLDHRLSDRFGLHLAFQRYHNDFTQDDRSLGSGVGGPKGDFIYLQKWEDRNTAVSGRLSYSGDQLSANLGAESSRSKLQASTASGVFFGGPSTTTDDPLSEERRGVYANATWLHGPLTITPGLRYDFHSNSEEVVSPSLGLTWQLDADNLLRASAARGFSAPFLARSNDNPELQPEIIWAYQAGIETRLIPLLLSKLTLFHLDIDQVWNDNVSPIINDGQARWNGFELDLKSIEYQGFSLAANFTWAKEQGKLVESAGNGRDETYSANLIFAYLHRVSGLRGELAGNYLWFNYDMLSEEPTSDMLWDLTLSREFQMALGRGELFVKARNIFNGNQFWDVDYPNPGRWLTAGASFRF